MSQKKENDHKLPEDSEMEDHCQDIEDKVLDAENTPTDVNVSIDENIPTEGMPKDQSKSTELADKELVQNITLLQYYTAGIVFLKQIEMAVPHLINLLASNTKGEVVEAMHFFVVAYGFEMECAMVDCIYLIQAWGEIYGS
jgi:condensin complex subunit 1